MPPTASHAATRQGAKPIAAGLPTYARAERPAYTAGRPTNAAGDPPMRRATHLCGGRLTYARAERPTYAAAERAAPPSGLAGVPH